MKFGSASKLVTSLILLPAITIALTKEVSYNFKAMPHVHDKASFHNQVDFSISGRDFKLSQNETQIVLKISPDGSEVIKDFDSNGVASLAGRKLPVPPGPPSVTYSDGLGRLLKMTGGSKTTSDVYRLSNLTGFVHNASDKASAGWTSFVPADPRIGAVAYVAKYKVTGIQKIGQWQTYKINFTVKETSGKTKAWSDGTMWLCKGTGWPAKIIAHMHNVPFSDAPSPVSGTLTVARVS